MKILKTKRVGVFLAGLCFGAVLTFALSSVASRAQNNDAPEENRDPVKRGNCTVRMGTRRLTNNISCYPGEVVTGVLTTSYYCSPLIVDCNTPEN